MNHFELFIAQQAAPAFLVSWWKAVLMLPPFIAWAWLISSKLDKDAKYFHLNFQMWNGIFLGSGAAALAAMILIPTFWASFPAGLIVLLTPVVVYWKVRDASVPESQKFKISSEGISARMSARAQARAAAQALLQFTDAAGKTREVPLKDQPLFPVHMLAEDLIGPAVAARASRVELAVSPQGTSVRQTIDGIQYKRESISGEGAVQLIQYLKDIAGMSVEDHRRKQAGQASLRGPDGNATMYLVTEGSSTAQRLRIDFDREKRLHKPFDGIGLLPPQLESLKTLVEKWDRHGIVLVGAPPGHGLTTSAYAFLSRHDAYTSNVKTLEREIQVELIGVDQVQWDPSNPDIDYATNLQSMLRRDPDVMLVADIRDSDTARVAAAPGMQGPLIYVQQPLPTIAEQIRDWAKRVGDTKDAVQALRAVTNQRLLRTLCPNCKQAYQPTPEQLKKLNLPANKVSQLFRAGGKVQVKNKIENCMVCGGTGYLGLTAAFEVFVVDDDARKLLIKGDLNGALADARRKKMIYLQEAALKKVVNGDTTIEEVIRVTAPAKTGENAPSSSPQPTPAA